MLKPGQFYVIASLAGVCAVRGLARWLHVPLLSAALAGIAVTFGLRLLAISFNWKTKSVLQPPVH